MKRILFTASQAIIAALLVLSIAKCSVVSAAEIYDWSNAAANNNSAPPDGFPENMNYSEVNDAARELMAVVKRYVEAVDGTNTTAGTEPAYTLTSGQSLSTGAAGRVHVWTAHATSTGSVTFNVDEAGAKNLVDSTGTQVGTGGIVSGGVYMSVETASNHRLIGSLATPAVTAPASSTDNAVARFNGTGGTVVQDSGVIIDDSNNVSGAGTIDVGNADTTLSRASAGNVSIEGNVLYRAGGTDVPVTDGGNGRSTATAYAVITGGTTATGAHQSIASVGTLGQVLTSNGAGQLPTFEDVSGNIVGIQSFTSTGTYTPTANTQYVIAFVVGAGGGGGGADGDGTNSGGGGGGGGGGLAIEVLDAATIGASQSVTIGAGGTAGVDTGGDGGDGGTTSLGALLSATGGAGGDGNSGGGIDDIEPGGAGGAGSGGDVNSNGAAGGPGIGNGATTRTAIGGNGGSSFFDGGVSGGYQSSTGSTAGANGAKGSGGSGAADVNSATGAAGGVGGDGFVMIVEFASN